MRSAGCGVRPRSRVRMAGVAMTIACALIVAACGSEDSTPDVPTVTPASAVAAPPAGAPPAGTVVTAAQGKAIAATSGRFYVLSDDGTTVLRFDRTGITGPGTPGARITTPALTSLIATADGSLIGAGPDVVVRIGADNKVSPTTQTGVTDPTVVARTADGRVLVGTVSGSVVVFGKDLSRERTISGFVRVDGLTVSPAGVGFDNEQVVVLDRAQSSVTPINIDDGSKGAALRAGNGATTSTVDSYGRVLVANTRDGEILGFFGKPIVNRFRYPVSGSPYAVAWDQKRHLLWVSATAVNQLIGFDLADGEPAERHRVATVVQPDSLAVDDSTGALYVLSARGGGVQIIDPTTTLPSSGTP
ncbi:YncE family protein [Gordonia sp. (in: high G+C Gram-positive bacteria)]|uniref:YncE family protein n=2 Tax=Gordonia TaxID=2053 RepID=UPI002C1F3F07|nr:hypothetical protein [Gordonia sp. (in: high G+C Gram-positive bacteria)]HMS75382.1 hypothetical protein [Gordonia sp. (in: high G+C Gram-positive bacteria)]